MSKGKSDSTLQPQMLTQDPNAEPQSVSNGN